MIEVWKDIKGYEGLYQVSNLGNIRSMNYNNQKGNIRNLVLIFTKRSSQYYRIMLSKQGKRKIYSVHRLVGITFIPNPENRPQINHKDGNKLNNNKNNLEWCTVSENGLHAHRIGLQVNCCGELAHSSKLTEIEVIEIKKLLKEGELTQTKIGQIFNVHNVTIHDIEYNKTWKNVGEPND